MKYIIILMIVTLIVSCNGASLKDKQSEQVNEEWELRIHTFSSNSYTKDGLLDTTFTKTYSFLSGIPDTTNSIIIRQYENGRLIRKKDYSLYNDGAKELINESINQYDKKGNLMLSIKNMGGQIITKATNDFNNVGQLVKRTTIFQMVKRSLDDYIIDSAVAHRKDKKQFQNDTTLSLYDYDVNGNLIKAVITDIRGRMQRTEFTQYSGKKEMSSFSLNSHGDTISTSISDYNGNLIKQIKKLNELGNVDTIWVNGKNIIKTISHNSKMNIKYKTIYTYNERGDEIESITYR